MQNQFDPRTTTGGFDPAVSVGVPRAARDAGLRSYMLKVYKYMASGVLLTGIVALLFANTSLLNLLVDTATGRPTLLMWGSILGSFGLGIWLQVRIFKISAATAMFWTYAGLLGVALTSVFLVYTGVSIRETFFAVTAAFLGLSLWGYTTKKDLSGWGTFLFMGVIGVFAGIALNIGIAIVTGQPSTTLDPAISAIGVLVFAGLTAYDTQKIKGDDYAVPGTALAQSAAINGALHLYIDFINMFLFLLRFLGDRE